MGTTCANVCCTRDFCVGVIRAPSKRAAWKSRQLPAPAPFRVGQISVTPRSGWAGPAGQSGDKKRAWPRCATRLLFEALALFRLNGVDQEGRLDRGEGGAPFGRDGARVELHADLDDHRVVVARGRDGIEVELQRRPG